MSIITRLYLTGFLSIFLGFICIGLQMQSMHKKSTTLNEAVNQINALAFN